MSDKPAALVAIDDLAANIRSTMARAPDVFAPSMRRQVGQLVSYWLRKRLQGEPWIYPGMAKMAKWGQCSERQARENFSRLRNFGVVTPVSYATGGRRSTRFVVSLRALFRALVSAGANPSQALREKVENPEVNPEVRGDEKPEVKPEPTSAGIQRDMGKARLTRASKAANAEAWVTSPTHNGGEA